jgi:HEAT repeat protein
VRVVIVALLLLVVLGMSFAAVARAALPARTPASQPCDDLAVRAAGGDARAASELHRFLSAQGNERRRLAAVQAIGRHRVAALVPSVLAGVASGAIAPRSAVAVLAQVGPAASQVVDHACGHPDAGVRAVAVRATGRIGGPAARWTVLGGLQDRSAPVRTASAAAAAELGLVPVG